jgi:hypothetical protein
MDHGLDPLDSERGRQMYLDERRYELADATLQSHSYRLKQFVAWCERGRHQQPGRPLGAGFSSLPG